MHRRSVHKFAPKIRDLLGRFYDGLPGFRVIADHDKVTVMRRHRPRRIRRADDRECLHCECKTQQDAEGERFHIAVPLCIICAIEIVIPRPWLSGRSTTGR
jgi:hypothetical protein